MNNIPQKIWLNVGLNNNDEKVEDFKELSEVTWSEEKIFDRDIPFERAINKNNLWHSVADVLPPLDTVVLINTKDYGTITARYDKGWEGVEVPLFYSADCARTANEVDYWMEIPQLPKKGGE